MQKSLYSRNNNISDMYRMADTKLICAWFNYLSLFAVPSVLKFISQNKRGRICYIDADPIAKVLIKLIRIFIGFSVEFEKIVYSLGDMKIGKESIGMHLEETILTEVSQKILARLQENGNYKRMLSQIGKENLDLFFEISLRNEIFPFLRLCLIVEWYQRYKYKDVKSIIMLPNTPLAKLFKMVYQRSSSMEFYNSFDFSKSVVKNFIKNCLNGLLLMRSIKTSFDAVLDSKPRILVSFQEGFDTDKRSDIFWYLQSGIEPNRIFVYFDPRIRGLARVELKNSLKEVSRMGMHWVCFEKRNFFIPRNLFSKKRKIWIKKSENEKLKQKFYIRTLLDIWLFVKYKGLLISVIMWKGLLETFNVKIVFDVGSIFPEAIAQSVALNMIGGVRIRIQRSTMKSTDSWYFLKYSPDHICFVWGREIKLQKNASKVIKKFIISGFPFDKIFHKEPLTDNRHPFDRRNIKFTVALFDNAFSDEIHYSEGMMRRFYGRFLEWVINDEEVAIILKDKKPLLFNQLRKSLISLFGEAEKTGRFIRLKNSKGQLPAAVSFGTDMVVGFGISSAVIETVIAGQKGIHCDLPGHHLHPYYKWGYEKVIFDDIDKLISALKKYKDNSADKSGLGDWSSYIDTLDPFRDGRSGERIGNYIRWLLESFDEGKNRDESMRYADKLYAERWGADKIINLQNIYDLANNVEGLS